MFNAIKIKENAKISCKDQFNHITELLQLINFWPKGNTPDNITKKFHLKMFCTFVAVFIPAIFPLFHAYHYRSSVNPSMVLDLVAVLVFVCFIVETMIMQIFIKDVVLFLNQMSSASTGPEQSTYNNFTFNYKKLGIIIRFVLFPMITAYSLFGLWDSKNCEARKIKYQSFESCGLMFYVYFPFDYDFFPLKHLLLLWEDILMIVVGITLVALSLLLIAYIDKTVGSINYIIDLAKHLNSSIKDDGEVKKTLRKIVIIHQVIIRERQQVNDICRLGNMARQLLGRLVMALSIFDILENGNIKSVIHLLFWIIEMGILETAGQIIIDKGQQLDNVLYDTKWYEMNDPKDRKTFTLLYLMAQQPLSLYAGPFSDVSKPSLLEILKSTYSVTATLIKMVK